MGVGGTSFRHQDDEKDESPSHGHSKRPSSSVTIPDGGPNPASILPISKRQLQKGRVRASTRRCFSCSHQFVAAVVLVVMTGLGIWVTSSLFGSHFSQDAKHASQHPAHNHHHHHHMWEQDTFRATEVPVQSPRTLAPTPETLQVSRTFRGPHDSFDETAMSVARGQSNGESSSSSRSVRKGHLKLSHPRQVKPEVETTNPNPSRRPIKTNLTLKEEFAKYEKHDIILAGLLHHGAEITVDSLNFVVDLACRHKVPAHILAATDTDFLQDMLQRNQQTRYVGKTCATIRVEVQPRMVSSRNGRIRRIQLVRDYQRRRIQTLFGFVRHDGSLDLDNKDVRIVLADLDINAFPSSDQVVQNAKTMTVHGLCAAGIMKEKRDTFSYYDTFATILLPNTFVYPIRGRLREEARPEEDSNLIVGKSFSAQDLYQWFQNHGGNGGNGAATPVQVKSCFGGLTIYQASIWLNDQKCSYENDEPKINEKYANKYDSKPCEHVVLHNCLHSKMSDFTLAVQPDMTTLWHSPETLPDNAILHYNDIAQLYCERHALGPSQARQLLMGEHFNSSSPNRTDDHPLPRPWFNFSNPNQTSVLPPTRRRLFMEKRSDWFNFSDPNRTNALPPNRRRLVVGESQNEPNLNENLVDVFIAGFPKTGTTSLLAGLAKHKDVSVVEQEYCRIMSTAFDDEEEKTAMEAMVKRMPTETLHAIKCPVGLATQVGLRRLAKHSPHAQVIVGLRHPVWFFQSFYNYRVTELYNKGIVGANVPPAETLIDHNAWLGVSTHQARYEFFLGHLAQGSTGQDNSPPSRIEATNFQVLLYTLEGMKEQESPRSKAQESDLASFLELDEKVKIPHENKNHFVGDKAHPETIDICQARYNMLRSVLVQNGNVSQAWIRDVFLPSAGVTVGDKEQFLREIETWQTDPCVQRRHGISWLKNTLAWIKDVVLSTAG